MSKIIFVPSEFIEPERMVPVNGHITVTVNGALAITQASQFVKIEPQHRPPVFYEAAALIGLKSETTVSDDSIQARYWHKTEMIDWLEANLRTPIIIQRSNQMGPGWRIGFSDMRDFTAFNRHFHSDSNRARFELVVTEIVYNEITEWLRTNISGEYDITRRGYGWNSGEVRMAVKLKDLTDATLFKLRWHGEGKNER